jgi:hypothetical protein
LLIFRIISFRPVDFTTSSTSFSMLSNGISRSGVGPVPTFTTGSCRSSRVRMTVNVWSRSCSICGFLVAVSSDCGGGRSMVRRRVATVAVRMKKMSSTRATSMSGFMSSVVSSTGSGGGGPISATASANVGCSSIGTHIRSPGPRTSSVVSQSPSRNPSSTPAGAGTGRGVGSPAVRTSQSVGVGVMVFHSLREWPLSQPLAERVEHVIWVSRSLPPAGR